MHVSVHQNSLTVTSIGKFHAIRPSLKDEDKMHRAKLSHTNITICAQVDLLSHIFSAYSQGCF